MTEVKTDSSGRLLMRNKKFDFDKRAVSFDTPLGLLIKRYNDEVFKLEKIHQEMVLAEEALTEQEVECKKWSDAIHHLESTPE